MRVISEFTIDEAMDFWDECGVAMHNIFSNEAVSKALSDKLKNTEICKLIANQCQEDVKKVLLWIDSTPITPFNLFPRMMAFLNDVTRTEEVAGFFTSTEQTGDENASGAAMDNTQESAT